ncbi:MULTISPECIES: hypothetical protein [unclassified Methanoregula]|uniref:hypothetical protein n=1 Tax=unclassified Methanoregula TaxID=2649730 RepID=UPI0009C6295F|nr:MULTISPECIES: hypothetical protein [unclassified Methanoregula]OPX64093.1 MAG: hypothetical protein A4E33_01116 [Methanoregula sp. PtaB.Bin085]OPY34787.1 MAG: hypothetical protein A4E34_01317 [Methanoregula sp. PtaU1.Bin006]
MAPDGRQSVWGSQGGDSTPHFGSRCDAIEKDSVEDLFDWSSLSSRSFKRQNFSFVNREYQVLKKQSYCLMKIYLNIFRIILWVFLFISGLAVIIWGLFVTSLLLIFFGSLIAFSLLFPVVNSIKKSEKIALNFPYQKISNESYSSPYHSIIIANSTKRSKRVGIFVGIDLLVNRIQSQKCKYKITLCKTPTEVKNEIENPNAVCIYLFGHGFKGGLTFYNEESISEFDYCTVNPTISKKFIGQFHCNSGNEQSLVELLIKNPDENNHYFMNGFTTTFLLWYDIQFKVIHKIKKC